MILHALRPQVRAGGHDDTVRVNGQLRRVRRPRSTAAPRESLRQVHRLRVSEGDPDSAVLDRRLCHGPTPCPCQHS